MRTRRHARAVGLLLGVCADHLFADPRRGHPVALFGQTAARLESTLYADSRWRGGVFALGCVGATAALGLLAENGGAKTDTASGPSFRWREAAIVAAATWAVLGGTTLTREAHAMRRLIESGDIEAARRRLAHLCGRDATELDAAELARATVESLAENTSDAVVAPLLWGALCGVPGLCGYRAVNTLDAMVGHRSARYERFGWAAARLDDVANLLPARATAVLAAMCAPAVGGGVARTARLVVRDGGHHPSPNAGRCEAAFAGALGLRLGGTNSYHGRRERRGALGDGRPPTAADIARAVVLARAVAAAALVLAWGTAVALGPRTVRG